MHGQIECAAILTISGEVKARTSQAGKRWLSFLGRCGNGDDAQWVQVAVFGSRAPELEGKLTKGGRCYVEGNIKLNTWQNAQGEARSGLSVSAKRCDIIGAIAGRRSPYGATEGRGGIRTGRRRQAFR